MFFRRKAPKIPTFEERLEEARQAGFTVTPQPGGALRVSRGGFATVLERTGDRALQATRTGLLMGGEIGVLVDGGFQKFFRTPSGRRKPALAGELRAIHDFDEDLKEALGLESYYNESLGTVSTFYLYDRVKDRDRGVPKRIWEE
jgi:hypothetical protein